MQSQLEQVHHLNLMGDILSVPHWLMQSVNYVTEELYKLGPIVQELGSIWPPELLANLHACELIHVGISGSDAAIQTWTYKGAFDASCSYLFPTASADWQSFSNPAN